MAIGRLVVEVDLSDLLERIKGYSASVTYAVYAVFYSI